MTTTPTRIGPIALNLLAGLAQPDPGHGRHTRGAEAARTALRRALTADDPDTAISAWLAHTPPLDGRTTRTGYRHIQTTATRLLESDHGHAR